MCHTKSLTDQFSTAWNYFFSERRNQFSVSGASAFVHLIIVQGQICPAASALVQDS